MRWALRSRQGFDAGGEHAGRAALFGIQQGSMSEELRQASSDFWKTSLSLRWRSAATSSVIFGYWAKTTPVTDHQTQAATKARVRVVICSSVDT